MSTSGTGGLGASHDEKELLAKIEHTREDLGETVETLAAKADVKAQAQAKATELARRVVERTAKLEPMAGAWSRSSSGTQAMALAAAAAVAATASCWLVVTWWRKR